MYKSDNANSTKTVIIALMLTFPVTLLIYENISAQYNDPSVIETIKRIVSTLKATDNDIKPTLPFKKQEQLKPIQSKAIKKLNIKAIPVNTEFSNKLKVNSKPMNELWQSAQKSLNSKTDQGESSEGDNPKGDLELSQLTLQADFDEQLLSTLIREGKAQLIAVSSDNSLFNYSLKEGGFWDGSFNLLTEWQTLSDRLISLSDSFNQRLRIKYQVATMNKGDVKFELRFTRQFNQVLVQKQLAHAKQGKFVGRSVFIISVVNGRSQFSIKEF